MLPIFKYLLICLYLFVLFAVAFYGFHRYVLVYLYIKHRKNAPQPLKQWAELPQVTVQLPMFNEGPVAERIIRETCKIDYPLDKLEIQVLDDSTDESAAIAEAACQEWAAKGYRIHYLHRTNREGYKAGALEEGLKTATGQFVAIFDADFIPPIDIFHNTLHHFTDEKVGMVQVRWEHLNRDHSLLTKSQALFLDGHFVIEHTARNRSGRFMHFNGTAGVWRRTTIADGGGWQHDTLTEDLDLSYRCQLKGWQFVYLPQYAAPAELPPEMIAFKQQAHRWTKGSFQTCLKLLPSILKSDMPYPVKSEAFFHLTNTVVYPLMVILTIMMFPAMIIFDGLLSRYTINNYIFTGLLFVLATCSASTFFIFAQKELFGRQRGWETLKHLPILMALGVGISLNNAKAVIEAIISHVYRKPSEFVRTPKYGANGKVRSAWSGNRVFTFKRLALPIVEMAFGFYMLSFIGMSLLWGFAWSSIPFLAVFAGGYFYVGMSSLWVLWKMHQDARTQPEVHTEPPLPPAVVAAA